VVPSAAWDTPSATPDSPPQGPGPTFPGAADGGASQVPGSTPEPGSLQAQRGLSGWMSPTVGHVPFVFPNEPVHGQPTTLGYTQQDFALSAPFWQDCRDEWSGSVHVRWEAFQTGAVLPDSGMPFPGDLWNVRLGTSYRHLFDNGWIGGANVSVGSASDQPFSTVNEMTAGVTAFLRVPQGEHNAWLFSLNYSTNSQVLNYVPIPGVAFFYAPAPWFQATIGFPFADVTYRPRDDLTLQVSYALLTNIHARATYRLAPRWGVYGGFDWENENYFRAERTDDRARFFYYDKRLTAGVRFNLARGVSLDLHGGYVFDRFYFEGRQLSDSDHNRVSVGDGPYGAFQLQIRY
jgi:hypothetical protein